MFRGMTLDISLSIEPMEAEPVDSLPTGKGWQLEPKVDGFRCVVFRDGDIVHLQSRRQKPLERYFPEVVEAARAISPDKFVLDGELVIPDEPFDTLQMRLHPAASRIKKLSAEIPARYVAFDLLADGEGHSLLQRPFQHRREALEAMFKPLADNPTFMLSRATRSEGTARTWLKQVGHGLDGIVAKRLDLSYRAGERAMQKFKLWRTVDCVVGGIYYRTGTKTVEYLLLGLYDKAGLLHYVGRCGIGKMNGKELNGLLAPLIGGSGFTGKAPGGVSRWSNREREPIALQPKLVLEAEADHIENGRFRHGSRFLRWRDDKAPEKCLMDQIEG
jgi:ATP-dependent DNA ligase